jgi:hypothetical protein
MIKRADLLPLIDEEREGELELAAELLVVLGALRVDAEDLGIARRGLTPFIAKLAKLFRSTRGIVSRIEDEHDVAAAEFGERDGAAGVVEGGEIGGLRAHR